ncbi:MAG: phytanoyl-CoA dioxygenase family protein [Porticoccaceae bacterium]
MTNADFRTYCANIFQRDGVIRLPKVLTDSDLGLVMKAFDRKFNDTGQVKQALYQDTENRIMEARSQAAEMPTSAILDILSNTPIPSIVAGLFGSGPVWHHEDQAWFKDAREQSTPSRRTPWHQDSTYSPFIGTKYAVVWMSLDPVPADSALEFIRGSHLGQRYNPVAFVAEDDTAPLYPDSDLLRIPNIEADRSLWDIVSWPSEPGDIFIFHASTLHGGGATQPGAIRRSLTIRFVGDDVVKKNLPQKRGGQMISKSWGDAFDSLEEGQPYHECGLYMTHPGWGQ